MEEYLIVDGYNVIGAWPELSRLKEEMSLEESRNRLIEILSDYQGYAQVRVILVFDAHQVPGQGGKYNQGRLQLVYTREKETADECIERLVSELSRRRARIHVATSDYTEQRVTFGKGALRLSARELLLLVESGRREIRGRIRRESDARRNSFDDTLSEEMQRVFEKWRRGENGEDR